MKRLVVTAALLLLCISFPSSLEARHGVKRYLTKESTVDMKNMNHIFLGWVDLGPEAFGILGYSTKAEWVGVIANENAIFQRNCQSKYLTGRTITAAKEKGDENAAGNDLYVKFSDVFVDMHYRIHLSIHFIDPKTNSEIASVPARNYSGRVCGLASCLEKALNKVGRELQVEVTGESKEKKQK